MYIKVVKSCKSGILLHQLQTLIIQWSCRYSFIIFGFSQLTSSCFPACLTWVCFVGCPRIWYPQIVLMHWCNMKPQTCQFKFQTHKIESSEFTLYNHEYSGIRKTMVNNRSWTVIRDDSMTMKVESQVKTIHNRFEWDRIMELRMAMTTLKNRSRWDVNVNQCQCQWQWGSLTHCSLLAFCKSYRMPMAHYSASHQKQRKEKYHLDGW